MGAEDIDVDSLVSAIENGSGESAEIPMGDSDSEPRAEELPNAEAAPTDQAKAAAPTPQEFKFKARGEEIAIRPDDPRFQQFLSQGYDYAQRMQEFNKKQLEIGEFQKQYNQWKERYAPIDDFAKQNPDWWKHVEESWANKDKALSNPQDPLAQELRSLKQELSEIRNFKNEIHTRQQQEAIRAADQALTAEIETMQKEYPSIDLRSVDDSGKTLETRVLEYAQQKGISDFKSAYLAFNHKALTQLAVEKAKEELSKAQVKNREKGLLGRTPAPTQGLTDLRDTKKSYDDIHKEILMELGIH